MNKPNESKVAKCQWWDFPLGLVQGCTHVSPECKYCRLKAKKAHWEPNSEHIKDGEWSGVVKPRYDLLDAPGKRKKPAVYAVWSDLFHHDISINFIQAAFSMMRINPQHTFIVLTECAERMFDLWSDSTFTSSKNVWLGISAENQEMYDVRIKWFSRMSGVNKVLSLEPLLGPIELGKMKDIGWVIIGAESRGNSPGRHCDCEWIYNIQRDCKCQGVPVFVKQIQLELPGGRRILRKVFSEKTAKLMPTNDLWLSAIQSASLWCREFPEG